LPQRRRRPLKSSQDPQAFARVSKSTVTQPQLHSTRRAFRPQQRHESVSRQVI
jgi:hypothetical protein